MSSGWGYGNGDGPHTWCRCHPGAGGANQSPVNVADSDANYSPQLAESPLKLWPELTVDEFELSNTGASFMVAPASGQVASISGGPLHGKYQLVQLHMHWGSSSCIGSEHTRNGRYYAAELHLVHYNAEKFATAAEAMAERDGLCVLGAFVEVGAANPALASIFSRFADIQQPDTCVQVADTSLQLAQLLPDDTSQYFTYCGSLTTPPCTECVRWIVFNQPISASEEQLEQLRSLLDRSQQQLVNNYRSLVPLGARELLASFEA